MLILVKEHKLLDSDKATASSKNYDNYDACLKDYFQRLSDCVADTTVKECRVLILDEELNPIKSDSFTRPVEE